MDYSLNNVVDCNKLRIMELSEILFLVTTGLVIAIFGKLYINSILKINDLKKENLKGLDILKKIELQQKEEANYLANVLKHLRTY